MVNPQAQVSEQDMMKYVSQVVCRHQQNCKNKGIREHCVRCTRNKTGLHQFDYYVEKIPDMRFF